MVSPELTGSELCDGFPCTSIQIDVYDCSIFCLELAIYDTFREEHFDGFRWIESVHLQELSGKK